MCMCVFQTGKTVARMTTPGVGRAGGTPAAAMCAMMTGKSRPLTLTEWLAHDASFLAPALPESGSLHATLPDIRLPIDACNQTRRDYKQQLDSQGLLK